MFPSVLIEIRSRAIASENERLSTPVSSTARSIGEQTSGDLVSISHSSVSSGCKPQSDRLIDCLMDTYYDVYPRSLTCLRFPHGLTDSPFPDHSLMSEADQH